MGEFATRILCDELASRKARNPSYSLRAFARDLGVSVTCLSDVLGHKRSLSKENAAKIAEKLSLPPEESQLLASAESQSVLLSPNYLSLEDDTFRIIADWYYYAILSLARVPGSKSSPRWIAKRLGISEIEARAAIERLERLQFISTKSGKLQRTVKALHFQAPSAAMTKHYRQNLRLAERALDGTEFSERVFSSMTMAIDPSLLQEATPKVNKFKHQIAKLLESREKSEVYVLSVQLFPVSRKEKNS